MSNARPHNSKTSALKSAPYPNPNTQHGRLLGALLTGMKIDPLTAWRHFGIYRLSAAVFKLRSTGWPIDDLGLIVKNQFGELCDVAQYALPADTIEAAGWPGEAYSDWVAMGLSAKKRRRNP